MGQRRRQTEFSPEFVEFIPESPKEGVLYISIRFATATHRCACGCGQIVVTPIKPADWSLTWNGEEVSIYPSIGNWNFPCRSHYWIRRNRIVWARRWDVRKVEDERARQDRGRAWFYRSKEGKDRAKAEHEAQSHDRDELNFSDG